MFFIFVRAIGGFPEFHEVLAGNVMNAKRAARFGGWMELIHEQH